MEFLLRARLQLALLLTSFVFHALDMNFKFRCPTMSASLRSLRSAVLITVRRDERDATRVWIFFKKKKKNVLLAGRGVISGPRSVLSRAELCEEPKTITDFRPPFA